VTRVQAWHTTRHGPSALHARVQTALVRFLLANRTLDLDTLGQIDAAGVFAEPSAFEQAMAIFANNLVIDADGAVPPGGAQLAGHRAAQYIRAYLDPAYQVTPPFAEWELELHGPWPAKQ
jgi:hypothetical protein